MVQKNSARSSPGRPRSVEVDQEIVAATLRLLREQGPEGVTVEAVSQVSGSAKTTIYRRYRNRYELLRAALGFVAAVPEPSTALPVRERLTELLEQFRNGLENVVGLRALASLLHDGEDSEFAQAFREKVLQPRLDVMLEVLHSGVREGALRAETDHEMVVSLLAGSYMAHCARRGSVPADWAGTAVHTIWPAIAL